MLTSVFGWPRWIAAAGLVGLTACYTAVGGLAAVIVTDVADPAFPQQQLSHTSPSFLLRQP